MLMVEGSPRQIPFRKSRYEHGQGLRTLQPFVYCKKLDMHSSVYLRALRGEAFLRLKSDNESFKKNILEMEKRDRKEVRKLRENIRKREDSLERSERVRSRSRSRSRSKSRSRSRSRNSSRSSSSSYTII